MKKLSAKSISLLVVIFFAISAHAYDFSEVNSEGKTIFYNIVNEASKTCEVTYRDDRSVYRTDDNFQDYVGDVIFPESANGYQVIRIGRKACQSCKDLTSIVIPSSASCFITSKTSPTISGSRADVGSSKSITSGFIQRALTMAILCFCPPDKEAG